MIDPELLKVWACPACVTRPEPGKSTLARGELQVEGPPENPVGLRCKQCGRLYRIEEGIPNFLVEEATLEKTP
jgi:uncharacterized protein YbaR (Trm112 family)